MGKSPVDAAWENFQDRQKKARLDRLVKVIESNTPKAAAEEIYATVVQWREV